jgi:hypothetical protein
MIFVSFMNVLVSNNGITEIKGRWVNPVGFIDTPRNIKTPTEVLLIFSKDVGEHPSINIYNVSLGYYFNLEQIEKCNCISFPGLEDTKLII